MARFSLGREDDGEGQGSPCPRPKRQRRTTTTATRSTTTVLPNYYGIFQGDDDDELAVDQHDEEEEDDDRVTVDDRLDSYCIDNEVDSDHQVVEEERDGDEDEEEEEEADHEGEEGQNRDEVRKLSPRVLSPATHGNRKDRDLVGSSGSGSGCDGSISVILSDTDILDCPICYDPLSSTIFQCENGHIACPTCCNKVANQCPSCSWPIGYNRCRALEKVLESVKVSCQNMKYGCVETISYSKKREHEETCTYSPCSCPFSDCDYTGSVQNLCVHVTRNHPNFVLQFSYNCLFPVVLEHNEKYLILQEKNDGRIFVLDHGSELLGDVVNVNSIGPGSSKKEFSYDLVARNGDSSVRLQSFTESISRWTEGVLGRGFLLVPSDFLGPSGQLKLDACIRRHHENILHARFLAPVVVPSLTRLVR